MKKFYCEYNNGLKDRNCWCVVQADRIEDIKYTIENVYGFTFVKAWEM